MSFDVFRRMVPASEPERTGGVARGLGGELEPVLAGVGDDRRDVCGVHREGDCLGLLVEQHVERLTRRIPFGVAGDDDRAGHHVRQGALAGDEHLRSFT